MLFNELKHYFYDLNSLYFVNVIVYLKYQLTIKMSSLQMTNK